MPSSVRYWQTVAAIINYQSYLESVEGILLQTQPRFLIHAGFSRNNPEIFAKNNTYHDMTFSNCVVDLDTSRFINMTFV